ncbi:hypothetical protein N7474_002338 [Penicillium riverlandense]|uniref:uncharacterized protein n=1 Tax=Penicillium riverlandense TaxID=1903569 RepID=UPI00254998E4|nr:uncharacterized protein N7474_002338 [Penicillium riverlandense]KAJ5825200.1 hypothetical protein N7474_002338 [Penicillium riverlandense]
MHLHPRVVKSALLAASTSLNVPVSPEAPDSAVQAHSNFVGFGFETAFINDYANKFTHNLLGSIAERVGTTPTIRIGGTSGDRVLFDPSQDEVKVCIAGDCPIGSSATYILGPSYFDGFLNFQDFDMTFQAPLGPTLNISNTLTYVSRAYKNVGKDRLAAIAIGNEPNLYPSQYGVTYTADQYVNDSKTVMSDVSSSLGLTPSRIFEVLEFAIGSPVFNLIDAFEDNIDSSDNVKVAAWHYYQLGTDYTTVAQQQTHLMNHTAITSLFSSFASQIAYLQANDPDVQFVLSETGSGTSSAIQIQAGFGAALWCIDFQLYSLTQGVSRVDATHRPAALHSYWVPDDSAGDTNPGPQVRGVWYALPFIADFIGQDPGKVAEVDLGSDVLTAYAIYDASTNRLSKVALINLRAWVEGEITSARGSENVTISISSGNSTYKVQRLVSAAGAQAMGFDYGGPTENITWAGEQWSYSIDQGKGHLVTGVPTEETHIVTDGEVKIEVSDSEAVLVTFYGL